MAQQHHVWIGDKCAKCGILIYKAHSLKWGCVKSRVRKRRLKRSRKILPE